MSRAALEAVLDDFDPAEHEGADLWLGADLSASQDLTAVAAVVQTGLVDIHRADGSLARLPTYDAWVEAWTPKDTLAERALRDQAPYDVWVADGWLAAESGKTIRLDFVAARIAEISSAYRVRMLAYDRYAYRRLEEELDGLGLTIQQVEHPQGGRRRAKPSDEAIQEARQLGEPAPQGLWMPGSLLELENLILERRIRIRRSPVVISAIMSAAIERDPFDNRWFSKRRAVNRIDPLIALAMAVGAATGGAGAATEFSSIWDRPELWASSPPSSV
jgi:phage terminase large subunit-like protein